MKTKHPWHYPVKLATQKYLREQEVGKTLVVFFFRSFFRIVFNNVSYQNDREELLERKKPSETEEEKGIFFFT
jgi:hypothetical protein